MRKFKRGETVTIKSEDTPMIVVSFDASQNAVKCVWIDGEKTVRSDDFPEEALKTLEDNAGIIRLGRGDATRFLLGDIVKPIFVNVRMTVAAIEMQDGNAQLSCCWLNTQKELQWAVIPGVCVTTE